MPTAPPRADEHANIASHLPAMARRSPHALAVAAPAGRRSGRTEYLRLTYEQLDRASDEVAIGLTSIGVGRGTRVALLLPPSLDFFALVFGILKSGAVMVCVDPGIGLRNLKRCLDEAGPETFVGVARARIARRLLGWGKRTVRISLGLAGLEAVRRVGARFAGVAMPVTRPDDDAAILFTSGSTGPPKGVVYTHAHFQAQVAAIRAEYGIEPGEVDVCTFPLFALFAPALGMSAVVPEMDFTRPGSVDPRRILEPVEDFGATNLFGSPALLDTVGRWGEASGAKLRPLRRVISAGAPMSARTLERFTRMLPDGVQVFTPYGATEALPVASIGSDEVLRETRQLTEQGRGVCVGRPVGGVRVRIMRITDEAVPAWSDDLATRPGDVGEIVVEGPVVTASYFGRPDATALAKIRGPSGEVLHRMGDLGYLDVTGRLWFCGRKSQRVRAAGGDLYTIPCEGVFNAHPKVRRSALVGVPRAEGARPVLAVELEAVASRAEREAIARELLERGAEHEPTRGIRDVLFHPRFPVDIRHNAKIGREKLALWASRRLR